MLSDVSAHDESWIARAALCELLSLSFRYPDDVLADVVSSGDWACAAREITGVLGLDLSGDFDEGCLGAAPSAVSRPRSTRSRFLHDLRVEATRLFVGAPEPACSPYEGTRRAEAEGAPVLMFVNPHSMEVERFATRAGSDAPRAPTSRSIMSPPSSSCCRFWRCVRRGQMRSKATASRKPSFPEGQPPRLTTPSCGSMCVRGCSSSPKMSPSKRVSRSTAPPLSCCARSSSPLDGRKVRSGSKTDSPPIGRPPVSRIRRTTFERREVFRFDLACRSILAGETRIEEDAYERTVKQG